MIELRDYQREAVNSVLSAGRRGVYRQLIALPTGTGKTVIFGALARQLDVSTLILAHRDELIEQAVEKLRLLWPGVDVGVVKAERNETGHQVTVASVQTLTRPRRLRVLNDCELLITDEAHHAVAPTYQRIYDQMGDVVHVGVTATPQRADRAGLGAVFDEVVFHRSMRDMIEAGYLSDLRGLRLQTDVDLSAVRTVAGDFVDHDLARMVNTHERNGAIVEAWLEHSRDRKTLAFTVDVKHAETLAQAFAAAGVRACAVSGETPTRERRTILLAFRRGDLDVLANCQLLTEGYDEPSVSCIVVARPTQSQGAYVQMIGRGTRLYPGKADCLVLDVVDNTRRHSLVQLPQLFGLEYAARDSGQPSPPVVEQLAELDRQQREVGRLVVEHVDLFERSRFLWLAVGDGFFLPVPGWGQIRLCASEGGYGACLYLDPNHGNGVHWLTDRPLDLGWAQGIAEDEARRLLADRTAVISRDAPWRWEPATTKQMETLARMRVPYRPGITKGEASDLIARRVAERKGETVGAGGSAY